MTGFRDDSAGGPAIYRFGPFTVDRAAFRLTRDGVPVRIEPKAFQTLLYLMDHHGQVVTKDELLDAVWEGVFVTPNALTRAIAHLRRTLGDDAESPRYIETVPTRGYRFVGREAAPPASAPSFVPTAPPRENRALLGLLVAGFTALIAVIIFSLISFTLRRGFGEGGPKIRRPGPNRRVSQLAARPLPRAKGLHLFPSFSPDGTRIAFSSDSSGKPQIFITSLSGGEDVQVTAEPDGAIQPSWSPDGREIAYVSAKSGGIRLVAASGGTGRQLTRFGSRPSWSADGDEIAFQTGETLEFGGTAFEAQPPSIISIVSVRTGRVEALTERGLPPGGHGAPAWRSDGKRLAFASCEIEHCAVYTIGRDGSSLHQIDRLSVPIASPMFSSDGGTLYYLINRYNGSVLVGARLGDGGQASGAANVLRRAGRGGLDVMQHVSIARDGSRFAWSQVRQQSNLMSVDIRPDGSGAGNPPREITRNEGMQTSFPSLSPDGTKIAWSAVGAGADSGVWIANSDGGNAKALSTGPEFKQNVEWGRSGWEVFYWMWQDGPALFAISLISGETRLVMRLPRDASSPVVSPDRERVAFNRTIDGITSVWTGTLESSAIRRVTDDSDLARLPVWSPSGTRLAVQVRRPNGTSAVGVLSANGGALRILTAGGEDFPHGWSADERFIAFASRREGVWNIWSVRLNDGTTRELTNNQSFSTWMRFPVWSPDRQGLVYESGTVSSEIWTSNPMAVQ